MVDGTIKKIEWDEYAAPNLNITVPLMRWGWKSCGTASLALVTKKKPRLIEKHCPNVEVGWHTRTLARYLVNQGYTVVTVTKNSVTNVDWSRYPLTPDHCLMINGAVDTKENTWYVLHKNVLWHNLYVEESFNTLFFLNKPTQDVLLVWHPKWA